MIDDSLKKINRIIAILTSLQAKRIVKAQDLADRFGVSLRTIYRDVKTLESAGVPILSEAGIGYSLVDGYRLPPVMFTREEAGSLVTGEKLMRSFSDKSLGDHYQSAIVKIRSVLKSYDKEWLDTLEETIQVRPPKALFNSEIEDSLHTVLHGIADRKSVILEYKAITDIISEREIEPVGIFHENNNWYILGFCLLRGDYRQFRTDRILAIRSTPNRFTRRHGKLSDHLNRHETFPRTTVRLLVEPRVARYLANTRNNYGFVSEIPTDRGVEMTFHTIEIAEGFPRWILSFADYIRVLEPRELKDHVGRLLQRMAQYQDT
ncbi:MAG: YafY family transcriptional regulator [Leadbetterella sp.]|nr:YafY family transcriptional regulator [Leadbetterella sp.]